MRLSRVILLLFLAAQVLDGIFTYVGVHALGPGIERNFIIATWMGIVGPLPTLIVAKSVAAAAGILLYSRGLHGTVACMTGLYAAAAIGPWLIIYASW